MLKKITVLIVFSLMFVSLSTINAQNNSSGNYNPHDPGVLPNGDLDPDYRPQFQSSQSDVVTFSSGENGINTRSDLICEATYLNRSIDYLGPLSLNSEAYSTVRSWQSPWYPCDLDRVGARARLWSNGVLKGDSGMQNSYNSADAYARTYTNFSEGGGRMARGNHEFQEGAWSTSYVTDK